MVEGEDAGARWWQTTVVAGLVSLVTVGVGWWLSADTDRAEADRAARREAYVDLVGAASDCQVQILSDFFRDSATGKAPAAAEITADLETPAEQPLTTSQQAVIACTKRLQAAEARVALVADDRDVVGASYALGSKAIATGHLEATKKDEWIAAMAKETAAYEDAQATFVATAHDDVTGRTPLLPVPAPVLALGLGTAAATAGLAASLFVLVLTFVADRRSRPARDGPPKSGVPVVGGTGDDLDPLSGPAEAVQGDGDP